MKRNSFSLIFPCIVLVFSSCNTSQIEEQQEIESESQVTPFYIRNADSSVVSEIPADLLSAIHSQLLDSGRMTDAKGLEKAYDFNSGKVKTGVLAKRSEYIGDGLRYKAYVSGKGWMRPSQPAPPIYSESGFSSCRWEETDCSYVWNFPMTGFFVAKNNLPDYWMHIEYDAWYDNGSGQYGWYGARTWDQIAGPANNVGKIKAIRALTWTEGYHIWYCVRMGDGVGWLSWTYQNRVAGDRLGTNFVQGFTMKVYRY